MSPPGPVLSADSHVIEPPDLWQARLGAAWDERAPLVRRDDDGNDWWWVDAHRTNSFAGGTQTGRRFEGAEHLVLADRWEHVPAEVRDPHRYVEANRADGVVGSVLYPTQHLIHYKVRNQALVTDCCRAYNDWLAEFCAAEPARLRGVAALNVDDVGEAVAEAERAASLGLAAVLIPVSLPAGRSYADPAFEPLWSAVAGAGMPVCLHIATDRADPRRNRAPLPPGFARDPGGPPILSSFAVADHWVRRSIADLIFSGRLERHPGLQVGSIEHEAGWAAYFVDRLDHTYTQRATRGHRFADGALPSDFFRRQVFLTFSEDALAVRERATIGNLLFATDFPHSESTYPRTAAFVEAVTAGVGEAERHALLAANTATRFGFALHRTSD